MIYEYPARLVRIIDGDTVELSADLGFRTNKRIEVRLVGVDTAETYGVSHDSAEYKTGKKHERFVSKWFESSESLTVQTNEKGKYGRWLGVIFNESHNSLNDALLKEFDVAYS